MGNKAKASSREKKKEHFRAGAGCTVFLLGYSKFRRTCSSSGSDSGEEPGRRRCLKRSFRRRRKRAGDRRKEGSRRARRAAEKGGSTDRDLSKTGCAIGESIVALQPEVKALREHMPGHSSANMLRDPVAQPGLDVAEVNTIEQVNPMITPGSYPLQYGAFECRQDHWRQGDW